MLHACSIAYYLSQVSDGCFSWELRQIRSYREVLDTVQPPGCQVCKRIYCKQRNVWQEHIEPNCDTYYLVKTVCFRDPLRLLTGFRHRRWLTNRPWVTSSDDPSDGGELAAACKVLSFFSMQGCDDYNATRKLKSGIKHTPLISRLRIHTVVCFENGRS